MFHAFAALLSLPNAAYGKDIYEICQVILGDASVNAYCNIDYVMNNLTCTDISDNRLNDESKSVPKYLKNCFLKSHYARIEIGNMVSIPVRKEEEDTEAFPSIVYVVCGLFEQCQML